LNTLKKKLTLIAAIALVVVGFLTNGDIAVAWGENLALNQPAYSSSNESGSYGPEKAVDGNTSTRWASQFSDPQWIYVDLGAGCTVASVRLNWEAAYGSAYKIQVSDNASSWTDVYSTSSGDGGIDDINLGGADARYVRMYGTQRGTAWGYSLWEFEVYGSTGPPDSVPPAAPTDLTATAVSDSQISLDWADNNEPDLASYNVYGSTAAGGPYELAASGVVASAYNDTGLAAETTYYYVVTAVDTSSNESSASTEANATTLQLPLYKDPNQPVEVRVEDLLARMTLDEKIGQMTQCVSSVSPSNVASYYIGSVLSGGGDDPGGNNTATEWAGFYDSFQAAALSTRLGIPIIYGIDAVHGHAKVRDATVFPHNIGLGAANDPELMKRVGTVTAKEVAATGIDWTFGPCLAVVRDERWGRTYEGFAEDPEVHNNIVTAYIQGFQGVDANMQGEKIVACAKHYIGDGGTTWGTGTDGKIDQGDTQCTEEFLRGVHLPPYQRALDANVGTFMTSYSSWNGDECVYHSWLITDLLKTELGFDGFVISDWEDIGDVKQAINAGIDMSMAPWSWGSFISTLRNLVNTSQVPTSRIDDAVRRILRVKFRAGLFEHPYTDRSLLPSVGSAEHRAVAREAVRKSLVLLKNEGVLPIDKSSDIFVAGSSADSLIRQCGGWTIHWQGMYSDSETSGITILEGIEMHCTGSVTYNEDGYGAAGHDVAIVVAGEKEEMDSYAEGPGDDSDLHLNPDDISAINRVRDSGIPYVIVLISGRPMIITDEIADADAFVAAWLPGTEGDGVAEVLFGDYDFTGKLSYTWPSDMSQIPINIGDAVYDPLFPFGYGLGSPSDINEDGFVDWADVEVFCDTWLKVPGDPGYDPRANLYDDLLSIVNFYDYAIFANEWNPLF